MTLPSSGTINCSQIDLELGDSGTSIISLGDADARALAGVPSGSISMSDFYGKSSASPPSLNDGVTILAYSNGVPSGTTAGDLLVILNVGANAASGAQCPLIPGWTNLGYIGFPGGGGMRAQYIIYDGTYTTVATGASGTVLGGGLWSFKAGTFTGSPTGGVASGFNPPSVAANKSAQSRVLVFGAWAATTSTNLQVTSYPLPTNQLTANTFSAFGNQRAYICDLLTSAAITSYDPVAWTCQNQGLANWGQGSITVVVTGT